MRNLLRAIGGGLALGLAFFLVPVLGRVLLALGLLALAWRLLGRGRRRRWAARRAAWQAAGYYGRSPLPIDGQYYQPTLAALGPARQVALS